MKTGPKPAQIAVNSSVEGICRKIESESWLLCIRPFARASPCESKAPPALSSRKRAREHVSK